MTIRKIWQNFFMENLLLHVEEFAAIEADGKLTTMWANLKMW